MHVHLKGDFGIACTEANCNFALKRTANLLANSLDGVAVHDPHDHFAFVHWTDVRVVLGKLASQRDERVDLCANKPMSLRCELGRSAPCSLRYGFEMDERQRLRQ